MIDQETLKKINDEADRRHPLPPDTPGSAAFKGGMYAVLVLPLYELLRGDLWPALAFAIPTAASALVMYADTRMKWRSHAEFVTDEIRRMADRG